jgi:NAD(P)H-nitrite reductase large subunit
MNDQSPEQETDEIICDCTGTTKQKVEQLIRDGKDDLDKISSATGASTGCGSCDYLLMELIDAHKND